MDGQQQQSCLPSPSLRTALRQCQTPVNISGGPSEGHLDHHIDKESTLPKIAPLRPAAAVIPWRWSNAGNLEIYWVRRHQGLRFLPGWHTVPGGGLDSEDQTLAAWLRELHGGPAPPASAVCALREGFEEAGIVPLCGAPVSARQLANDRAALEAGHTTFAQLARGWSNAGAHLDPSRLTYAATWTTPAHNPIRFESDFFALEWSTSEPAQPAIDGVELTEGEWIEPAAALEQWRQGGVLLAQPTLQLIRSLADHGPEEFAPAFADPLGAHAGPLRRMEVAPDVWMFPLRSPTLPPATHTNVYVLGGEQLVVVDPGANEPSQQDALVEALRVLSDERRTPVGAICLTHHHPDHIAGVAHLAEAFGAPVYAHPETANLLPAPSYTLQPALTEGAKLSGTGGSWHVVHTPGHAPGHICLYNADSGALIGGDMTSSLSTIILNPPEGHLGEYLASLDRLLALGPRTLFPAHGTPTIPARAALQAARDHRLERNEQIVAAWRGGVRSAAALRPRIYPVLDPRAHRLAERQIEAHLVYLRERELITR